MANGKQTDLEIAISQFLANQNNAIDRTQKLLDQTAAENAKGFAEQREAQAELRREISKLGKQIGGLHNKFGMFTEHLAMASIKRILEEEFKADFYGKLREENAKEARDLEIDAWGIAKNGIRAVFVVEIKSKFEKKHIRQVRAIVRKFRQHHPEYDGHGVYPVIAAVELKETHRKDIFDAGIYLIDVADGVFRLAEHPDEFQPDGYQGLEGFRRDVPQIHVIPSLLTRGHQSQRSN